jgi:hypothetical protein
MSAATVPVTITSEAAARVTELGMQTELDQMLEHTRQTIPQLSKIAVDVALSYDTGTEIGVSIEAYTTIQWVREDRTQWDWWAWQVRSFPPQVCEHFSFHLLHEGSHAG